MDNRKVEVKINVPPKMLTQAERIAEDWSLPIAEMHRQIWIAGLIAIASQDTTLKINEKTRRRLSSEDLGD